MCYERPFTHRKHSEDVTQKIEVTIRNKMPAAIPDSAGKAPAASRPEVSHRRESERGLVSA